MTSYSKRGGEEEEEDFDTAINTQMGSALPNEKLDLNNFASWEYKMHQYLVRVTIGRNERNEAKY